jgi:prefoldin subunit 5
MSDKDNSVKSGSYVFRETKESASRISRSSDDIEENREFEKDIKETLVPHGEDHKG